MSIVHIAILLLALWVLVRGILTLQERPFPSASEQRFRDKSWAKAYDRAGGRADILTGAGALLLWFFGVQETVGHFLFVLLVFLGMVPGTICHALVNRTYEAKAKEETDALTAQFLSIQEEGHDLSLLSLAQEHKMPCVCYPKNASFIGCRGSIRYCYIDGYSDMVFAANPEHAAAPHVYPLALNFSDFLRLILACGSADAVEQISRMPRGQFQDGLKAGETTRTDAHKVLLDHIADTFSLAPMENPYDYVKNLQLGFDDSKVKYPDAYYKAFGIKRRQTVASI